MADNPEVSETEVEAYLQGYADAMRDSVSRYRPDNRYDRFFRREGITGGN